MSQLSRSPKAGPRPLPAVSIRTLLPAIVALLAALVAVPSVASAAPLIFIDAGHGGIYNHARYGKLKEKTVNLWLALELARQLRAQGYAVGLTRTYDTALTTADIPTWGWNSATGLWSYHRDGRRFGATPYDDLQARVDAANAAGADLFISLHNNGSGRRRANGTETWASPNDPQGIALGRLVQRAVVSKTKLRNRGAFQTDFYVLKWSNMPAVLVEGAFLTNRTEARKLANSKFRRKLVSGIVLGVNRWFATAPLRRVFTRLEGASSADVAASASVATWPSGAPAVLLTSASDYSRALACAPLSREMSATVLFADAGGVPASTLSELARLRPSKLLVLASADAVPDSVVSLAAAAAGGPAVERIAGADRVEASTVIADRLIAPADATVVVAPASQYADVISASAYAAAKRLPLVLTEPGDSLSPAAATFFAVHSADITRTVVFGAANLVTDAALSGMPNVSRIAGDDIFRTNTLALRAAYPWPEQVRAYVVSPTGSDALVASVRAANTPGGVPLLNAGRVLSPWTREWISNMRGRTSGLTIVGGEASQPALVDVMIDKARH